MSRPPEPAITPELLLRAYAAGLFPMAEDADDPHLHWVEPRRRGVIPLGGLLVPRRLARTVRQDRYEVRVDRDFEAVVEGCARAAPGRERTWISGRIRALYAELFARGGARTVEAYEGGRLVGGLYGVALGGAFFGESMFREARDASKVALVHLVARLNRGGYRLLDAQFVTDHLASLGAVELGRAAYRARLAAAVAAPADEAAAWAPEPLSGAAALAGAGATGASEA